MYRQHLAVFGFGLAMVLWGGDTCAAQEAEKNPLAAPPEAIRRWRAMRFGMFIHWGPVSLVGTEIGWSRAGPRRGHRSGRGTQVPVEIYDNLYKRFNPVRFDADEWVRIAQRAGMRYLVFTTKHHDGFCNFDSKLTDYKITSPESPYGRDICRQIADACHRAGLALGWYYSPPDWHHPDYHNGPRHARYIQYLHGQVEELLTNYGRVDIMWFDGLGGRSEDWDSPRLLRLVRRLQPEIVINNRGGLPGDFDTPEQRVGSFNRQRPWETCMTLGRQWAWKPNDQLKSATQCIQTLLRVVGGDGNFLFNVGPMPDGRIEPRQVERLEAMGQWLQRYGDGVYQTRGGPYMPGRWGASTCRDEAVWLFIMNWPEEGPLRLPPIDLAITGAKTRSGGQARLEQTPEGLAVWLDKDRRDAIATVIQLTVSGKAFDIQPVRVGSLSGSLAFGKPAKASNVYRDMHHRFGPDKALDDDPATRWATDAGTHEAWLEVDLGRPQEIGRAVICEAYAHRVRRYVLEGRRDGQWVTLHEGTTLGERAELRFAPVTARVVRLNIIQATEGPTIWEFQVFGPDDKPKHGT